MATKKGQKSPEEATVKYANAQLDEKEAREKGRHGPDAEAVAKAKKDQADALNELDEATAPEGEDTVTLKAPNERANVVDSNGVSFKDGVAENVPRSLAERYLADFEGYSMEGSRSAVKSE